MAGKDLVVVQKDMRRLLVENKAAIKASASVHLDVDNLCRLAINQLRRNPYLANCSLPSILDCVIQSAETGMRLNGRDAHMVPFRRQGVLEAQFMPDYKGLCTAVKRGGEVEDVQAEIVYIREIEEGRFKMTSGSEPNIHHEPLLYGDKGEIAGAYASFFLANGRVHHEWMGVEELDKIRNQAKAKNGGKEGPAYREWPLEMMKKAPIRRGSKYFNLDDAALRAIELDNLAAAGKRSRMVAFETEGETPENIVDTEFEEVDLTEDIEFFWKTCADKGISKDDQLINEVLEKASQKHNKPIDEMVAEYGASFKIDDNLTEQFFDYYNKQKPPKKKEKAEENGKEEADGKSDKKEPEKMTKEQEELIEAFGKYGVNDVHVQKYVGKKPLEVWGADELKRGRDLNKRLSEGEDIGIIMEDFGQAELEL